MGDEAAYHQRLIIGVTTGVLVLAILSCILRFYARYLSKAQLWYDDYFMCAGMAVASVPCICNFVSLRFGYGQHAADLPPQHVESYLKSLYVLQLAWSSTFPTIKVSVLFFYRRLFPNRSFLWTIYGIGLYTLLCFISNTLVIIFQCWPIEYWWRHDIEGHCININAFYMACGALNLFSDIFILLMPIPILWNLKTSKDRKLGLTAVFLLGGFACIVSFIRILYLDDVDPEDITWSNVGPGLLSASEGAVLVVSANLPLMRPLYGHLLAKFRRDHTQQDDLKEMQNSLVMDSLESNVKTDISQGQPQTSNHSLAFEIPPNQVGVRTEVIQETEPRDQMV